MSRSDRDRFRLLFERAPVGVAFLSLVGELTDVNSAACLLMGRSEKELVGSSGFDAVHPDERDDLAAMVQPLFEGRIDDLRLELRLVHPDGTVVWAESFTELVRAPDGTPHYLQAVLLDITARNVATERQQAAIDALRALEARTSAILESALDCIITMDHHGRVVEFNPAAEQTFGYARAEVIGRQVADIIIPTSLREPHRHGLAHYLATGAGPILGQGLELMACRADGTEFPVALAVTRVDLPGDPVFTG